MFYENAADGFGVAVLEYRGTGDNQIYDCIRENTISAGLMDSNIKNYEIIYENDNIKLAYGLAKNTKDASITVNNETVALKTYTSEWDDDVFSYWFYTGDANDEINVK